MPRVPPSRSRPSALLCAFPPYLNNEGVLISSNVFQMVFGPPKQVLASIESLNTSAQAVWAIVDSEELKPAAFPVFIECALSFN